MAKKGPIGAFYMEQMSNGGSPTSPGGEVLVYEAPDGVVCVDVRVDRETVWLTQRQMAEVFDTTPENVVMHLRSVFSRKELEAEATTKDFLVVRMEGRRRVQRSLKHFNLDAIISVGYRVNSRRGVLFRQLATRTLRNHMLRGYTLNERRAGRQEHPQAGCGALRQRASSGGDQLKPLSPPPPPSCPLGSSFSPIKWNIGWRIAPGPRISP